MATELAIAGDVLPLWYAPAHDYVMLSNEKTQWLEKVNARYNMAKVWHNEDIEACFPWGWSKATVWYLERAGINPQRLPSTEMLEKLRALSHRRLTIEAHRSLKSGINVIEASSMSQCEAFLNTYKRVIGKYPWSSTGRGLFSGNNTFRESFLNRCMGAINHQGSVMLEPYFDVITDFAMLYKAHSNSITFEGFSLFNTNKRAYTGNILLSDSEIKKELSFLIDETIIDNTSKSMCAFLNEKIAGHYQGFIGVDMFVYRDNNNAFKLNPCVEINLRTTMGIVAHELVCRHLGNDFSGTLKIEVITNKSSRKPFLTLNPPESPILFNVYDTP